MSDAFFPTEIDLTGSAVSLIETSTTNPRVVLDKNGLRGFDAGGAILFNIDATTGHITATGLTIDGSQITAGTITATQIANGTISAIKIANNTITATQIANGTISAAQIANNTITSTQIANGTITSAQIANGTITSTQIANGTIGTTQIAAGAVTTSLLAAGSVTSTVIANNTITATNIANGVITTTQLSATAGIIGTQIANGTITTTQIAANTIVAGNIAASTITGTQIAATTIDATKLNVATLSAISANMGTITAGTITGATFQTSAADPRVAFDSTGFYVTDGTGVKDVIIDSSGFRIFGVASIVTRGSIGFTNIASSSTIQGGIWGFGTGSKGQIEMDVYDQTGTKTFANAAPAGVVDLIGDNGTDSSNRFIVSLFNAARTTSVGATILNGSGRSTFIQTGATPQASIVGSGTVTWPGGSAASGNLVISVPGATVACFGVASSSTAGGVDQVLVTAVSGATSVTFGGVTRTGALPAAGTTARINYIVWGT